MAKDVRIPVRVDGAPQAQSDLKQTGEAVQDLGKKTGGAKGQEARSIRDAARATAEEIREKQRSHQAAAADLRVAAAVARSKGDEAAARRFATAAVAEETKLQQVNTVVVGKGAQAQKAFSDEAKAASVALLSAFNPALAAMVSVIAEVVKGLSKINPILLAIAAAAAVITAVTSVLKGMAAAAEDVRKSLEAARAAMKALREEGKGERRSVADALAAAGVTGGADQGAALVNRLKAQGVEPELGKVGAVAQQVGGLTEAQVMQFIAGYFAEGGGESFTRDRGKNQAFIQKMLTAGAKPENAAFMQGRIRDVAPDVAASALPQEAMDPVARKWYGLIESFRKQNILNDADAKALERYLNSREADPDRRVLDAFSDQVDFMSDKVPAIAFFGPQGPGSAGRLRRQVGDERVTGGTRTVDDLVRLAEQLRQEFAAGLGPAMGGGAGGTTNFTFNMPTQNIAQLNQVLPTHLRGAPVQDYDSLVPTGR
jgi:hypothetical protein